MFCKYCGKPMHNGTCNYCGKSVILKDRSHELEKLMGSMPTPEDEYQKGYKDGHANGYDEGYTKGFSEGKTNVEPRRMSYKIIILCCLVSLITGALSSGLICYLFSGTEVDRYKTEIDDYKKQIVDKEHKLETTQDELSDTKCKLENTTRELEDITKELDVLKIRIEYQEKTTVQPTNNPTETPMTLFPISTTSNNRSEAVLRIQRGLNKLYRLNLKEDKIYGPETKKAVERFQKDHGLEVTGVINNREEYNIFLESFGDDKEYFSPVPTSTMIPFPTPTSSSTPEPSKKQNSVTPSIQPTENRQVLQVALPESDPSIYSLQTLSPSSTPTVLNVSFPPVATISISNQTN